MRHYHYIQKSPQYPLFTWFINNVLLLLNVLLMPHTVSPPSPLIKYFKDRYYSLFLCNLRYLFLILNINLSLDLHTSSAWLKIDPRAMLGKPCYTNLPMYTYVSISKRSSFKCIYTTRYCASRTWTFTCCASYFIHEFTSSSSLRELLYYVLM